MIANKHIGRSIMSITRIRTSMSLSLSFPYMAIMMTRQVYVQVTQKMLGLNKLTQTRTAILQPSICYKQPV